MRAIKVEYTVKPEYVNTNKANIQKVMDELRSLGDTGILYSTYIKEDGRSFVHFAIYSTPARVTQSGAEENMLTSLESFKAFSQQLKAEGLQEGEAPHAVKLEMVAKSFDF